MKKTLLLSGLLAVLLTPLTGWAQDYYETYRPTSAIGSPFDRYTTYQISARYNVAMPIGDFKNYLDQASVQGFTLSADWLLPSRVSLGGQVGYQYFQQRLPRQIYQVGGQDISAVQTRTFTAIPVMLVGKYHLAPSSARIRPYLQLGAGGSINNNTTYYGSISDAYTGIRFAGNAAIGSRFLFGRNGNVGADVQVGYQHIATNFADVNAYTTLNASVGITYRWW